MKKIFCLLLILALMLVLAACGDPDVDDTDGSNETPPVTDDSGGESNAGQVRPVPDEGEIDWGVTDGMDEDLSDVGGIGW